MGIYETTRTRGCTDSGTAKNRRRNGGLVGGYVATRPDFYDVKNKWREKEREKK